jgi:AAA+ ATPase superfamily predicted ATPase
MKPVAIKKNNNFIGRKAELNRLSAIDKAIEPAIIVVYGRRRVGKTELIEQAFRERNVLKFEGIEGQPEERQMQNVLQQLSEYAEEPWLAKVNVTTWTEIFKVITKFVNQGIWTVYFEEIQWLADYKDNFISELKYAWDNYFRHNSRLIVILCGSSPSFAINNILGSKALYNRSQHAFPIKEFNLLEAKEFLPGRSDREIMDAYLSIGGIPEYLKWVSKDSSVFLSLCKNSFTAGSFFAYEYARIFISSLANNKHYKKIIEFLSKRRFAARDDILNFLKLSSGGGLSDILLDLEICGFISKYSPYNLGQDSLLARYCINDAYLQFYFKFIKPINRQIDHGDYNNNPVAALLTDSYYKWLGYAFERMCRNNHRLFAKILGFDSIAYNSGVFFNRATNTEAPGYQIDLLYDRSDKVYTICEIKYLQAKVDSKIIAEFEKKMSLFSNPQNRTIQKVLITTEGADENLTKRNYFDRIIALKDIFAL